MLKYRLISFPLLLLLAFLVVFWNPGGMWLFAVLMLPISAAAIFEIRRLAGALKLPVNIYLGLPALWLLLLKYGLGRILTQYRCYLPSAQTTLVMLFAAVMLMLLFDPDRERAVKSALATPGAVMLSAMILLPLASIYFEYDSMIFLMLVLCTKASDTGGYIVGMISGKLMKNGNHKIVPSISPKKSWEGTVGAALFSMLTAYIFLRIGVLTAPLSAVLIFGFLAFLGSFAGDLTESQLKRAANIKDSGNWIPGMGGILDVIDSFIYNAPLFYLALINKVI